jgi:hypothetical protein
MVCHNLSHLKKYRSRPSPPLPANNVDCRFRTFVGNDGFLWSSQPDASNVFHWIRVLKKQSNLSSIQKKSKVTTKKSKVTTKKSKVLEKKSRVIKKKSRVIKKKSRVTEKKSKVIKKKITTNRIIKNKSKIV